MVAENLKTMIACIKLGLKLKFKGNPSYVIIDTQSIPDSENEFTKYYLILMEGVPGGTGFLEALYRESSADGLMGEGLLDIMKRAKVHLENCVCGRVEDREMGEDPDGCYRCIRTYEMQYDFHEISRNTGIRLLEKVIEAFQTRVPMESLEKIQFYDVMESQLEARFLSALETFVKNNQGIWNYDPNQKSAHFSLPSNGASWRIFPQKDLTQSENVSLRSRPDFVIEPIGSMYSKKIAVFIDGFEFHVEKNNRILDDCNKRQAILNSKEYFVFYIIHEKWNEELIDLPFLASETSKKWGEILSNPQIKSLTDLFKSSFQQLCYVLQNPISNQVALTIQYFSKFLNEINFSQGGVILSDTYQYTNIFSIESGSKFIASIRADISEKDLPLIKPAWKGFMRYTNLFQFAKNFSMQALSMDLQNLQVTDMPFDTEEFLDREDWRNVLQKIRQTQNSLSVFVQKIGNKIQKLPVVEYYLNDSEGYFSELAWVDQKLAILNPNNFEERKLWVDGGWKVYSIQDCTENFASILKDLES
jgi:hypothetical protein